MISESVLFGKHIFYTGSPGVDIAKSHLFSLNVAFTLWAFTVCKLKRVKHICDYINCGSTGYFRSIFNNFISSAVKQGDAAYRLMSLTAKRL